MTTIISAKINIFDFENDNKEKINVDNVELVVSKTYKRGVSRFNEVGAHIETYKVPVNRLFEVFGVCGSFPIDKADRFDAVREFLEDKVYRDCILEILVDVKGKPSLAFIEFKD